MRFSSILLLLDSGSSHTLAMRRAVRLARNEKAALTVGTVINHIPSDYRRKIVAVTPPELLDMAVAEKRERIERLIDSIDTGDVPITVRVLVGKPHVEIAGEVKARHHDLVIKSITGRRALVSLSAQWEDRELLRSCPCPVWLVNARDKNDDRCILAALDKGAEDGEVSSLNDRILEVSTSIALAEFRDLHVVHAWQLPGEGHLRSRGTAASNLEVDRMIARETSARMDWLQGTVNAAGSDSDRLATDFLSPQLHVLKGSVRNVVPELAEKLGAGLIVMGTAARTGIQGMWVGNTSEKILSRSDASFLIVKQAGPLTASEPGHNTLGEPEPQTEAGNRASALPSEMTGL